jgi:hypothetical protein
MISSQGSSMVHNKVERTKLEGILLYCRRRDAGWSFVLAKDAAKHPIVYRIIAHTSSLARRSLRFMLARNTHPFVRSTAKMRSFTKF